LTPDAALAVLTAITCAPITRTTRGIRSEVAVGTAEGLPASSVITCDNVITIPVDSLDDRAVGHLDLRARADLDRALATRSTSNTDGASRPGVKIETW